MVDDGMRGDEGRASLFYRIAGGGDRTSRAVYSLPMPVFFKSRLGCHAAERRFARTGSPMLADLPSIAREREKEILEGAEKKDTICR
jgi:hypothetical protein